MKGLSLRNYPIVLAELRGREVADKMMGFLAPEIRHELEVGTIVPGGWYPVAWKRELHRAGRRATGEPRLARIMGNEMTKRDLNGVYRTFIRIASPQFVIAAAARIFSRYLRPGRIFVSDGRPGFTRVHFQDCYGFDEHMWQDVIGGCEAALQLTGAKLVRVHVEKGGQDGDTTTTGTAFWANDSTTVEDIDR